MFLKREFIFQNYNGHHVVPAVFCIIEKSFFQLDLYPAVKVDRNIFWDDIQ